MEMVVGRAVIYPGGQIILPEMEKAPRNPMIILIFGMRAKKSMIRAGLFRILSTVTDLRRSRKKN